MAELVFDSIAVDCPNATELANFYANLLGVKAGGDWVNPFEDDTEIWFQQVENYAPPTWPTQERGQQAHFEMITNNVPEAVKYAVSIGATIAPTQPEEDEWAVMLDPAGHPFCLCTPFDNVEAKLTASQRERTVWIALGGYTIDCPDGEQLWHFYQQLADLKPQMVNGMAPALLADTGLMLLVQQVDDYAGPTWPTQERGQQMHIDFRTSDRAEHVERALALGATQQVVEKSFTVMLDPVGHPFCICDDND